MHRVIAVLNSDKCLPKTMEKIVTLLLCLGVCATIEGVKLREYSRKWGVVFFFANPLAFSFVHQEMQQKWPENQRVRQRQRKWLHTENHQRYDVKNPHRMSSITFRSFPGVKSLKIPKLEPMKIESVSIEASNSLKIDLKNIEVYGLSGAKVTNAL